MQTANAQGRIRVATTELSRSSNHILGAQPSAPVLATFPDDRDFEIAPAWVAKLSGHGDFAVIIDFSTDPWTGDETFVGFVQLK
jgi:hypothetical protein